MNSHRRGILSSRILSSGSSAQLRGNGGAQLRGGGNFARI